MAWTQGDIDTLAAAVASGTLTITYDGPPRRSITYQSLSEMRALLADMRRDVAVASGKVTTRFASVRKGL